MLLQRFGPPQKIVRSRQAFPSLGLFIGALVVVGGMLPASSATANPHASGLRPPVDRYAGFVAFRGADVPSGAIRVAAIEDGTWTFVVRSDALAEGTVKVPSTAWRLSGDGPWATGRIHVKIQPATDDPRPYAEIAAAIASEHKLRFVRPLPVSSWSVLDVGHGRHVGKAVAALRRDPRVALVEASMLRRLDVRDFDENVLFPQQWHLQNTGQSTGFPRTPLAGADLKAVEAWERTFGNPDITIAILDSGQDDNHPDFPPESLRAPYDALTRQVGSAAPDPGDITGAHGIACAGLAAAPRGGNTGVVGVCPDCTVMPVRIFSEGDFGDDTSMTDAFVHLLDNNAAIASNSWGFGDAEVPPELLRETFVAFTDLGRGGLGGVILFAIGNTYEEAVPFEIALDPNVLAIGGTGFDDLRVAYSTFHSEIDLVAPTGHDFSEDGTILEGAGLITTDRPGDDGYNPALDQQIAAGQVDDVDYTAIMSGTSGACPNAAGVAGLILSYEPQLTYAQVFRLMADSAEKVGPVPYDAIGHNAEYGFGRVDANFALALIDDNAFCVAGDEICGDGIDNDCDLSVDSEDRDCGFVPPTLSVPYSRSCVDDTMCDDGFCVPLNPSGSSPVCTATCFAAPCSSDGVCVVFGDAFNEAPLCMQACGNGEACPTGTACASTADGRACLPPCEAGAFCPIGLQCTSPGDTCRDPGGAEPEPEPELEPEPLPEPVPEPAPELEPEGVEPEGAEPESIEPEGGEPDGQGPVARRRPGRVRIASVSNCSQTSAEPLALLPLLGVVALLRRRRRKVA